MAIIVKLMLGSILGRTVCPCTENSRSKFKILYVGTLTHYELVDQLSLVYSIDTLVEGINHTLPSFVLLYLVIPLYLLLFPTDDKSAWESAWPCVSWPLLKNRNYYISVPPLLFDLC